MKDRVRRTIVAGSFYPDNPDILKKELFDRIVIKEKKQKAIALISPHAGYYYSGSCAGKGFGTINIPDRVIILGLDHSGMSYPYAIDGHDVWDMPMGELKIDSGLRDQLAGNSKIFKIDINSGKNEHSIEVQVPFLQYLNPNVKILPILISGTNYDELETGGIELANLIKSIDENILIIASTDMSHYLSSVLAKEKDTMAIDEIKVLDPEGLLNIVRKERISMCGVLPVVMSLIAAKKLGANQTQVIEYTNSGEISGDFNQVVGYLSMAILKD